MGLIVSYAAEAANLGYSKSEIEKVNDTSNTEVKTKDADESEDETKYEQSKSANQQKTQRDSK